METDRINYSHICCECGNDFNGFKNQHTCWRCITYWIRYNILRKENIWEKHKQG